MSNECRILDINVVDNVFTWTYSNADMEGHATPIARDTILFNLDKLQEKTIEKFIQLQHFLVDKSTKSAQVGGQTIDDMTYGVVETLGEHLFHVLFIGKTADYLQKAMEGIGSGEIRLLRIQLEFRGASEKLASWPWEYLRIPVEQNMVGAGHFLALQAQLVLNRSLTVASSGSSPLSMKSPRPVPVVLVVSTPEDLGPVVNTKVIDNIQNLSESGVISLNKLIAPRFERSTDYHPTATIEGLTTLLADLKKKNQAPVIIHFIGHGRRIFDQAENRVKGQLAFMDTDGCARWIDDDKFANLVAIPPKPKLVFLQACESGLPDPRAIVSGVAQQIAGNGILAVVAMQARVQNNVATEFACQFYESLKTGMPVDWAVMEGRQNIGNIDDKDMAFGTPVLYLRSYEGLIGEPSPKPQDRNDPVVITPPPSPVKIAFTKCPRCQRPLKRDNQKFCLLCGLRFVCTGCGKALDDPMEIHCGECGVTIEQQPWQAPEASKANVDGLGAPIQRQDKQESIGKEVDIWNQ